MTFRATSFLLHGPEKLLVFVFVAVKFIHVAKPEKEVKYDDLPVWLSFQVHHPTHADR